MKICFLILHYLAINETKACVQSIFSNVDSNNYEIVIVDNGSNNTTGEELKLFYCEKKNVTVIIKKENLGFARGNNVGFSYAVEKLKCDYICMMNNDTLLLQNDFCKIIEAKYLQKKVAVIGPRIRLKNGDFTKILPPPKSLFFYRKALVCDIILYVKMCLGIDGLSVIGLINKIIGRKADVNINEGLSVDKEYDDVMLHGCCLIFTPEYIKKFNGINDKTFLYREEELLFLRIKENGMHSLYTGDLEIVHLEDVATNMVSRTSKDRKKRLCRNRIKSTKVLISEMKKIKRRQSENGTI